MRMMLTEGAAGEVVNLGNPGEHTVLDYARRLANHERSHVKHIGRLISAGRDPTSRRTADSGRSP